MKIIIRCRECGHENRKEACFCANCNKPLSNQPTPAKPGLKKKSLYDHLLEQSSTATIISSVPYFTLAVLSLVTWISPQAFAHNMVAYMAALVVMEFIAIHSAGFLGFTLAFATSKLWVFMITVAVGYFLSGMVNEYASEHGQLWLLWAFWGLLALSAYAGFRMGTGSNIIYIVVTFLAFGLLYTELISDYALKYNQPWLFWALWALLANRISGALARPGEQMGYLIVSWVTGTVFLIGSMFIMLFPLPELGVSHDLAQSLNLDKGWDFKMNGKPVKPHYMLAWGVVYFTISGLWVMSGKGDVANLPGLEEPEENKTGPGKQSEQ